MAIIYTYPTKAAPTADDLVLISDAADSNKTKNAKISSIQSLVSGVNSVNGLAGAVLLDAASSNLVRTTTPGTNTISYDLASSPTVTGTVTAAGLKPSGGSSPTAITHFEQGIWTPTFEFTTDGVTYQDVATQTGIDYFSTGRKGYYTRINNLVTLQVIAAIDNSSGAVLNATGFRITGIPFEVASGSNIQGQGGSMSVIGLSSHDSTGYVVPHAIGTSIDLNYLTANNPDPTYFGGTDTFAPTTGSDKILPLANNLIGYSGTTGTGTGIGSQLYLNKQGDSTSKYRLKGGANSYHGTVTYLTT
jgi:hypothetical protein